MPDENKKNSFLETKTLTVCVSHAGLSQSIKALAEYNRIVAIHDPAIVEEAMKLAATSTNNLTDAVEIVVKNRKKLM